LCDKVSNNYIVNIVNTHKGLLFTVSVKFVTIVCIGSYTHMHGLYKNYMHFRAYRNFLSHVYTHINIYSEAILPIFPKTEFAV